MESAHGLAISKELQLIIHDAININTVTCITININYGHLLLYYIPDNIYKKRYTGLTFLRYRGLYKCIFDKQCWVFFAIAHPFVPRDTMANQAVSCVQLAQIHFGFSFFRLLRLP